MKFNFKTEMVDGICPTCASTTILVSLTNDYYRCMTCGSDLKQHINGKIAYIPMGTPGTSIKLEQLGGEKKN